MTLAWQLSSPCGIEDRREEVAEVVSRDAENGLFLRDQISL